MWLIKVYQLAIALAVGFWVIWDGTLQNGYAMGFLVFLVTWFATAIPVWTIDWYRRRWGKDKRSLARQLGMVPTACISG